MEIAIRICVGGAIIVLGIVLYGVARAGSEFTEDLSWEDVVVYLVIGLIGIGIAGVGDRILEWPSLPNAVRWTCIGALFVAGGAFYLWLQRALEQEVDDTEALILYGIAFFLLSVGIGLVVLEIT